MPDAGRGTIDERKRRWCDFYDMTAPPRHVFLIRCNEALPERPLPHPDNRKERIDWAWGKYRRDLQRARWLDDDSIPHLDCYTGTEIFAEAFGCEVHRPANDMPFARPLIRNASEVSGLEVPGLDAPPLAMLFDIADELRRRAGPDAVVKMVDVQSPMDVAALIWDKSAFYVAIVDAPEAVRELSAKVRELLTAFLDEWLARYGRDFVAHYPDYYMPRGVTLSEDEVGSVSERTFEDMFLPELAELSKRYGGIGIHCCADARHQWGGFKRIPSFRMLNLVQPAEVLREAYGFFAGDVPQMHSWCGEGEPSLWPDQYPDSARVVLHPGAKTREEAARLAERLGEVCRGRA